MDTGTSVLGYSVNRHWYNYTWVFCQEVLVQVSLDILSAGTGKLGYCDASIPRYCFGQVLVQVYLGIVVWTGTGTSIPKLLCGQVLVQVYLSTVVWTGTGTSIPRYCCVDRYWYKYT